MLGLYVSSDNSYRSTLGYGYNGCGNGYGRGRGIGCGDEMGRGSGRGYTDVEGNYSWQASIPDVNTLPWGIHAVPKPKRLSFTSWVLQRLVIEKSGLIRGVRLLLGGRK